MTNRVYIAVDLGAESGRVIAGIFDGSRLRLEEIHRFGNTPVRVRGSAYWDILSLFAEIKRGISLAARAHGPALVSIGVDTWGVDYGLLDAEGMLLGHPFHYRDSRTEGMMEEAFRRTGKEQIYRHTGIQFMFFNTIYQLLSEVVRAAPRLFAASRLLFIPDLINFWLSGVQVNERTIASTSQLYDPRIRNWSWPLIDTMDMPRRVFGEITDAGSSLGSLLPDVAAETGAPVSLKVIAPGCHDTASGVAAVPSQGGDCAYLSSGTWSLMGIESAEPIIDDRSFAFGFTNEIGVFGTVRVLKNISGLWLLQESRRTWAARGEDLTYEHLTRMATEAPAFASLIDPDCHDFAAPGDLPSRIQDYCARTGQPIPDTKPKLVRTALESLALKYRLVLDELEQLRGRRIETLHIVGGGARNELLNQFTSNAINRPVVTGPVESTSAGNILMQMHGTGDIGSHGQGRQLIRDSFETRTCYPEQAHRWEEALGNFARMQQRERLRKEKTHHG